MVGSTSTTRTVVYDLDNDGYKQLPTTFAPTEIYGKPNFNSSDRIAVLVNLGYVLKDGRDLQIRLCLEQQPASNVTDFSVDDFSVQYDTKIPTADVPTWNDENKNLKYGPSQTPDTVVLPATYQRPDVTVAAIQAYIFSLGYVNFAMKPSDISSAPDTPIPVFASKTRYTSGYVEETGSIVYKLNP